MAKAIPKAKRELGCTSASCTHLLKGSIRHIDINKLTLFEAVTMAVVALLALAAGVVYSVVLMA